jgi:hypothetical protein
MIVSAGDRNSSGLNAGRHRSVLSFTPKRRVFSGAAVDEQTYSQHFC